MAGSSATSSVHRRSIEDRSTSLAARPPTVWIPRVVVVAFQDHGVDVSALTQRLQLPAPPHPMPVLDADRLLTAALAHVRDSAFALRVGARLRPELFDAAGFAMLSGASYGEALRRTARYLRMFGGGTLDMIPHGATIAIRRRSLADTRVAVERAHVDFDLAFVVALGRLAAPPAMPLAIHLRGAPPAHAAVYAEVLGIAPDFDSADDEVVVAAEDLRRPLVSHRAELDDYFVEYAERLLASSEGPSMVDRVRAVVLARPDGLRATLRDIARALGTSERSLQRRIRDNGTSFGEIIDLARRDRVCELLATTDLDLVAVAASAGFASVQGLHRAFRRWQGITPAEYRASTRRGAPPPATAQRVRG